MNIYAYRLPQIPEKNGWIKVGQSEKDVEKRIKEQLSQAHLQYEIVFNASALAGKRNVTDKDIHRYLEEQGFQRDGHSEWFMCLSEDVQAALDFLKQKYINEDKRQELSDKFYEELRNWYFWATEEQYHGLMHEREPDPDHALRIIVRLLLIFFLKEKELVPKELFDENWIAENLKEHEHRYYNAVLRNLFFHCLNTSVTERRDTIEHKELVKNITRLKEQFNKIPFLNGGLFNEHPGDDFALNDDYFFSNTRTKPIKALDSRQPVTGIIKILSQYKYTLDETDNSEYIDPEFIGKTFECLLACIEAENARSRRKITGSYYTPREIVDYMVDEALDAYLEKESGVRSQKSGDDSMNVFPNPDLLTPNSFDENLLLRCAILDPACGSGAFPCGVMNAIMRRVDPSRTLGQSERYAKKLEILRNVIYGVDIQPMAAQITVLRLFLSMLQDITPTKDARNNFGIKPLPNLDYKFVVADTLMGINGDDLFFREHQDKFQQLIDIKRDYFRESGIAEKDRLKIRIESLEKELADQSGSRHITALHRWNHSDTSPAPYFDSRWMFSIEKFDIVIGNPPYGAEYPAEHKEYFKTKYLSTKTSDITVQGSVVGKLKGSFDTFSLFIENGFNSLKKGGYLTFIVPLSVISSDSMTALHDLLEKHCSVIRVASFCDRPQQIFRHSHKKTAIIGFRKDNQRNERIYATQMYRKDKKMPLDKLIKKFRFTNVEKFKLTGRYAKISLPIEKRILKKLFTKKHVPIRDLIDKEGKPIYYRVTGGMYYNVVTNYPSESMKEKPLHLDKKMTNTVGAILSSNLFWWYQQVYSNGLDLKSYEIESFPIPVGSLTVAVTRKIEKLYERYLRDIERHVVEHETQEYKYITRYKEYKIRYSKMLIDAIDDVICPLYGLTEEETEFIKNYELRFRTDKEIVEG